VLDRATSYNMLVDVWSLGIFAVELANGKKPFTDKTNIRDIYYAIQDKKNMKWS
jgi:serine/threonine protein kinase